MVYRSKVQNFYELSSDRYWTTNFNAGQHGGMEWTYSISSRTGDKVREAAITGMNGKVPFLARVLQDSILGLH